MAFAPNYLRSLWGRILGMTKAGELVNKQLDLVYSGLSYVNTAASTAVSNTTAETAFDVKYTLKKNTVRAGTRLKIAFQGIATATNSTDTLAIALKIGGVSGTALLSLAARDVANNDIFSGEFELVFRTIGATGTFVGWGKSPANPNAAGSALNMNFKASTTVDTTADLDIVVTATWSAQSSGDSCRLDLLSVERA
jgi:poly-gamma-glutamate capsule biosynthesis protein CapA/YwtB (metallophosphatase superfamily)